VPLGKDVSNLIESGYIFDFNIHVGGDLLLDEMEIYFYVLGLSMKNQVRS
jgi:hypothetical protein